MQRFPYTAEERAVLNQEFEAGGSDQDIADALNAMPINVKRGGAVRTARGINAFRSNLGLVRIGQQALIDTYDDRRIKREDDAFQRVMAMAIRKGCEHATTGIFKDPTPFVGRIIQPEPLYSGCSSSGALCAEIGAKGGSLTFR